MQFCLFNIRPKLHHRKLLFRPSNSQNDQVYDGINKVKKDVDCCRLLQMRPTFSRSVMTSVGISALGLTSLQFVDPKVKVNGDYYHN